MDESTPVNIRLGFARQLKRLADGGRSPTVGPPARAARWNPGVQRARVTTAIPTGTEASPSSAGKVRLKVRDSAGAWGDGEEVQVYNDFTMPSSLPVNRMVKVAWIAGQWWLVSASCS